MESNQKATLGCGTLILIALIVMTFSGTHTHSSGNKQELRQLQTEIRTLQSMVQAQHRTIQELQRTIEDIRKPESSGDHNKP